MEEENTQMEERFMQSKQRINLKFGSGARLAGALCLDFWRFSVYASLS